MGTRPLQVLVLLSEGKSVVEIADALGLSPGTVKSFRQSVRRYLGLRPGFPLDAASLREHVDIDAIVAEHRLTDDGALDAMTFDIDRRGKHLLRLSLTELEQLANRLTRRAALLGTLAAEGDDDSLEAVQLSRVARAVGDLNTVLLSEVRNGS